MSQGYIYINWFRRANVATYTIYRHTYIYIYTHIYIYIYTVKTEIIQSTLNVMINSIYLVNYCFFYENIVCIKSTTDVKQKQI